MKLQKFGYDLSALTEYTEEQVYPLVYRSLFDGATARMFPKETGIKYKEVINRMDNQLIIQDGRTCSFNATGDTEFSQRELLVGSMKVNQEWCIQDLEKYYMQTQLPGGSNYTALPFEQVFSELQAGLIAESNERALWQDSVASGDLFDGFLRNIDVSGVAIDGNTSNETSITTSNVIAIHDNFMMAIPKELKAKGDLFVAEGWDTFEKLIVALRTANNFYYNGVAEAAYQTGELKLPGWGVPIKAVHGLDDTDRIIGGRKSNFIIGTDMENEDEQFKIWYSDDFDKVRFKVRWKLGTQVAFPNEVIQYTNA